MKFICLFIYLFLFILFLFDIHLLIYFLLLYLFVYLVYFYCEALLGEIILCHFFHFKISFSSRPLYESFLTLHLLLVLFSWGLRGARWYTSSLSSADTYALPGTIFRRCTIQKKILVSKNFGRRSRFKGGTPKQWTVSKKCL